MNKQDDLDQKVEQIWSSIRQRLAVENRNVGLIVIAFDTENGDCSIRSTANKQVANYVLRTVADEWANKREEDDGKNTRAT